MADMTTGDLGGAGESPQSVEQGKTACPECGMLEGKHKAGCSLRVDGSHQFVDLIHGAMSKAADKTPEPFSSSTTSNWVARAGGLPNYIQHVAHALVRKGESESEAIGKAIGIIRNWAEGKGGVTDDTKAAAAKALAQWDKMKAATHLGKAKLDKDTRDALPDSDFVFPKERRYPIHDKAHALAALSYASGTKDEAAVRSAVAARYPDIHLSKSVDLHDPVIVSAMREAGDEVVALSLR